MDKNKNKNKNKNKSLNEFHGTNFLKFHELPFN